MSFTAKRRKDDDAEESGGRAGLAFPSLSEDDLYALREVARNGGGRHHVNPKTVTVADYRALRQQGLVELIEGVRGQTAAKLTARGLQALASAPAVLGLARARS